MPVLSFNSFFSPPVVFTAIYLCGPSWHTEGMKRQEVRLYYILHQVILSVLCVAFSSFHTSDSCSTSIEQSSIRNNWFLVQSFLENGEGNGNQLCYSCLENSMDRGPWRAIIRGVTKSWIQLSDWHFHFHFSKITKFIRIL